MKLYKDENLDVIAEITLGCYFMMVIIACVIIIVSTVVGMNNNQVEPEQQNEMIENDSD